MSSFVADGLEEVGRGNNGRVSWFVDCRHFESYCYFQLLSIKNCFGSLLVVKI